VLGWLTLIFCCQLAGELADTGLGLPVPGPVVGMALLFCGLLLRKGIPAELGKVGDALIGNLSLCFVPAGVGVMLHADLIGEDWLPISVALLASTLLAIAVTGLLMQYLSRAKQAGGEGDR
jgi:holin-like protein